MEELVSIAQLQESYKGKKVFLTGHTGFKGVWLSAMLKQLGADVKGYALAPVDSAGFFELFDAAPLTKSVLADIREREKLKDELVSFRPDFVFHLAAQPLVLRSYQIPAETFDVNVTGTANLLEAVRALDHPCAVVIITTDKVYDNKENGSLYREDDQLGGFDPYSASKACAELVVQSFRQSFFNTAEYSLHHTSIASARAGNVIGGGDWSQHRIIPDTVRALAKGEPVRLRNPSSVRPWQHVLEPLAGYLLLGANLSKQPDKFSRPYNFGPLPTDHLTVKELAQLAVQSWGSGRVEAVPIDQPHEAHLLQLDITRARTELNWQPKLTATEAIRWTIDWYRQDSSAQASFTFSQIDKYLSL